MDFTKLTEPFPAEDIEWRVQRADVKATKPWALVLAYVTNRAIQTRLDEVCGPSGWKNEYSKAPDDGVLCGISLKVRDNDMKLNEWITKYDGAENTQVEAVKGGLSGAMKRAAVQWGIGRYLYKLEANFVELKSEKTEGSMMHYDKDTKSRWYWTPPQLPAWALPAGTLVKETEGGSVNKSKIIPKQLKMITDILTNAGVEASKQKLTLANLVGQTDLNVRDISYLEGERIIKELLDASKETIKSLSEGAPF